MDEHSSIPPAPPEPPPYVPPLPPTPPPPSALPLPWEQPGYPFFNALFDTTKLFLTEPAAAFARVSTAVSMWRPFLYGCILGFLLNVFTATYQFLFRLTMPNQMPDWLGREMGQGISAAAAYAINILVSPFAIPLGILFGSCVIHLFLMLVGGAKHGFAATVRSISYSYAPAIIGIIPACGAVVAGIWSIVLCVLGLAALHQISRGKAVAAILLPIVLCCACFLPLFFIFGMKNWMPH